MFEYPETNLKDFLEEKADQFNNPEFIEDDPIVIPHFYSRPQDIEISGFFAATFAWGQRKTIILKSRQLMEMMDHAPHDFILNHQETDLKRFLNFKHRTFNATDCLYFIQALKNIYAQYHSMEQVFYKNLDNNTPNIEKGLIDFHNIFFCLEDFPQRTKKHVATPQRKAACKRINMFLRWMVRKDNKGVDFGIWEKIKPAQLICPCDLHVDKIARKLGLITRKQTDWFTALELTDKLKIFDPKDPVKYDFALFGLSLYDKF